MPLSTCMLPDPGFLFVCATCLQDQAMQAMSKKYRLHLSSSSQSSACRLFLSRRAPQSLSITLCSAPQWLEANQALSMHLRSMRVKPYAPAQIGNYSNAQQLCDGALVSRVWSGMDSRGLFGGLCELWLPKASKQCARYPNAVLPGVRQHLCDVIHA